MYPKQSDQLIIYFSRHSPEVNQQSLSAPIKISFAYLRSCVIWEARVASRDRWVPWDTIEHFESALYLEILNLSGGVWGKYKACDSFADGNFYWRPREEN